jgi:putative transposase
VLDSHAVARLALPETVSVALEEIAADMREGLLALAVGTGLQVMAQLMEADVAAVCGPKGKHNPGREAVRHGSEAGSVTLGWAPGAGASTPDAHRRRRD